MFYDTLKYNVILITFLVHFESMRLYLFFFLPLFVFNNTVQSRSSLGRKDRLNEEKMNNRGANKECKKEEIQSASESKKKVAQKKDLLKKSPQSMSEAELLEAKKYALEVKSYEYAITLLERFILICSDQDLQRKAQLELADTYFENGDFKNAGIYYQEYIMLYPGSKSKKLDYAKYKNILCRFYVCLKPPLDQTQTRKTLLLIGEYLKNASDKNYVQEVKKIQQICYERIFEYESDILLFYSKQKIHSEARLKDLKIELEPVMNFFEPKLLELEMTLALHEGDEKIATSKKEMLADKFPEYVAMNAAKPKKSNADRF